MRIGTGTAGTRLTENGCTAGIASAPDDADADG